MHYIGCGFHVVFQMCHEVCTVSLDLLIAGHGTEDNFGKGVHRELADCDATDDLHRF